MPTGSKSRNGVDDLFEMVAEIGRDVGQVWRTEWRPQLLTDARRKMLTASVAFMAATYVCQRAAKKLGEWGAG